MKDTNKIHDLLLEPPLQRKKRFDGPVTSLSSDFSIKNCNISQDYILLGKNEKFQHNIKYKCKPMKNAEKEQNEKNKNKNAVEDSPDSLSNDEDQENIFEKEKAKEDSYNALSIKDEEYILLGNHAKFSDNIVYKPKVRCNQNLEKNTEQKNNVTDNEEKPPVMEKKLPPARVIDTSKFLKVSKNHSSKRTTNKTQHDPETNGKEILISQETNPADLKLDLHPSVTSRVKNQQTNKTGIATKNDGKILSPTSESTVQKFVKFDSPPPAPRSPPNPSDDKQVFLGLLHKAGLALPQQPTVKQSEYQKNFTWKTPIDNTSSMIANKINFRLSNYFDVAASYAHPIAKVTEYQRNFGARESVYANPTPQIEQAQKEAKHVGPIKHRAAFNNTKLPISKVNENKEILQTSVNPVLAKAVDPSISPVSPITKSTKDNCDTPEPVLENSDTPVPTSKVAEDVDQTKQKAMMKRTKSLESISSSDKDTSVKPTESFISEYQKKFSSPSSFNYVHNAWTAKDPQEQTATSAKPSKCDWYEEVLELRRKAAEYRQRAFNTHFCSDHMAQLIGKQTELWENSSLNKSSAKATAIDIALMRPAGITYFKVPPAVTSSKTTDNSTNNNSLGPDNKQQPVMELEDVIDEAEHIPDCNSKSVDDSSEIPLHGTNNEKIPEHQNITNRDKESDPTFVKTISNTSMEKEQENTPDEDETTVLTLVKGISNEKIDKKQEADKHTSCSFGRIPTPELDEHLPRRHHLDRTTPTKGGALLSSLSKTVTSSCNFDVNNGSKNVDSILSVDYKKPKHCMKTYAAPFRSKNVSTFGKPSKDTHVMQCKENISAPISAHSFRRQDPSINQQLLARGNNKTTKNISNKSVKVGNLRHKKPSYCFPLSTQGDIVRAIPEYMGETYRVFNAIPSATNLNSTFNRDSVDDDILSQSLESSNTIISDVLERTRNRLNFW